MTAGNPPDWLTEERDSIAARRARCGTGGPIVGLALSGGGIRSASVSLGVLQAFESKGILSRVDYLSTVSGGGYTGIGWLSWLRARREKRAQAMADAATADRVPPDATAPPPFPFAEGEEPMAHLRNRASYLLPPDRWEVMKVGAMVIRKVAATFFRILCWLLVLAAFLAMVTAGAAHLPAPWNDPGVATGRMALVLLCGVLVIGVATCAVDSFRLRKPDAEQGPAERMFGWLRRSLADAASAPQRVSSDTTDGVAARVLVGLAVLLLIASQPLLVSQAAFYLAGDGSEFTGSIKQISAVVGTIVASMTGLGLGSRLRGRWVRIAMTVLAGLALAGLYAIALAIAVKLLTICDLSLISPTCSSLTSTEMPLRFPGDWLLRPELGVQPDEAVSRAFILPGVAALLGCGLVYLTGFISPNAMSMHSFYRNRLSDTFMPKPVYPLSGLGPDRTDGPLPIINAAINGVADGGEERRGRMTTAFTMTPFRIGARQLAGAEAIHRPGAAPQRTGFCPTKDLEDDDIRFDAASAMAISAAAVGGNQSTVGTAARFLRVVLGLQTARWLPNPALIEAGARVLRTYWKPTLTFREVGGIRRISQRTRYLLVSDGGHHENLGINALLHRGCDIIIAVDAEADPAMTFNGLAVSTRLARMDAGGTVLGVDPAQLGHDPGTKLAKKPFCEGDVHYGDSIVERTGTATARLFYIKASFGAAEPLDIVEYRCRNPSFPHETTADQFFSEEQFEVYRRLGEHIGETVLAQSSLEQRLGSEDWSPTPPPPPNRDCPSRAGAGG